MGADYTEYSLGHFATNVAVVANSIHLATTPVIYNVEMTLADNEYSQAIPAYTKMLEFRCQDIGVSIRYSFVTGKVATPVAPYKNLFCGEVKTIDNLNLTSITLYFACSTAGKVMEIECWT
jgi:hypothetical protein